MGKLYFKYGAMGSSKTANALMTRFNYMEKGQNVWFIKPATDTRDDRVDEAGRRIAVARSRIGLEAEVEMIEADESIHNRFAELEQDMLIDVIICDECQFLTENQVDELKNITDDYEVPVLCFGLRADFQTRLFPGSKRLFELADSITEIKSICKCGRKATVNARIGDDGKIVTVGEQVCIGGNDRYEGMCYKCYRSMIQAQKVKETEEK